MSKDLKELTKSLKFVTCCRGRHRCPEVAKTETSVIIRDDDHRLIEVKLESLSVLIEELTKHSQV